MTDAILLEKIKQLQKLITSWVNKNHLGRDWRFTTYKERFDDEPDEFTACVTVLSIDGTLHSLFNGFLSDKLLVEFDELMSSTDFYYEMYDYTTLQFHTDNEILNQHYLEYFNWQWISELIKPDYTSLHEELYAYLSKNPKKLYTLSSRQFEILISEIFRNQGYFTELGSGLKDGGVDLRLYQKDEIDQIVTLVQVKKYKEALPIKLESVAYLQAIVDQEKANRGLFITTSRYLPQAENFAARQNRKLILADSNDVVGWCNNVKTSIIRDKSKTVQDDYILNLFKLKDESSLVGKIVWASTGVNIITNDFCIILYDSTYVSLLMRLPKINVGGTTALDSTGSEIPLINEKALEFKNKENVFRARKTIYEGGVRFWGQKTSYYLWDKEPKFFDYND